MNRQILEIKVGYFCSETCNFCDFGISNKSKQMTLTDIVTNIEYFSKKYGLREIVLSGGEPTLRKDFNQLLRIASDRGLIVYLHTNAIRFSDLQFTRKCSSMIARTMVSFSAHTAELYWTMSGTRNFTRKVSGLVNLIEASIPLRTNTVVTRQNLHVLPEIIRFITSLGPRSLLITFPFIIGRGLDNFLAIIVTELESVRDQLSKSVDWLQKHKIDVNLQGFPPCIMRDFVGLEDTWFERAFVDSDHQTSNHLLLFSNIVRPQLYCIYCAERNSCEYI